MPCLEFHSHGLWIEAPSRCLSSVSPLRKKKKVKIDQSREFLSTLWWVASSMFYVLSWCHPWRCTGVCHTWALQHVFVVTDPPSSETESVLYKQPWQWGLACVLPCGQTFRQVWLLSSLSTECASIIYLCLLALRTCHAFHHLSSLSLPCSFFQQHPAGIEGMAEKGQTGNSSSVGILMFSKKEHYGTLSQCGSNTESHRVLWPKEGLLL